MNIIHPNQYLVFYLLPHYLQVMDIYYLFQLHSLFEVQTFQVFEFLFQMDTRVLKYHKVLN